MPTNYCSVFGPSGWLLMLLILVTLVLTATVVAISRLFPTARPDYRAGRAEPSLTDKRSASMTGDRT